MKKLTFWILFCVVVISPLCVTAQTKKKAVPPVCHNSVGDSLVCDNGEIVLTCIDQKHGYGSSKYLDKDIHSPKSVSFTPDGKKVYVNSLEGCKTVVYDTESFTKLKTIEHSFESGEGELWLKPSGFYEFTHYPDGWKKSFRGKPVEEAITPDAKYMFVPYYRRTFDINAQDPSALAVIDTEADSIVLMTETGPLPKMVAVSNAGDLLAITHWGDNTVGFLDISDPNVRNWKHLPPVIIGHKLNLNYSLTNSVDRDSGSGYALRGTVFLPGDSLMLVGGMGGNTAVIDVKEMKWIGMIPELSLIRHIAIKGDNIYLSKNATGEIFSVPIDSVKNAVGRQRASTNLFKINGVKKAKVGGGARTLKISPDGRYAFVACNSSSALYVVRTEDMNVVGQISVDSYPVGLDISPDGTLIAVTSQARSGKGGNAVNFFKIKYKNPQPPVSVADKKNFRGFNDETTAYFFMPMLYLLNPIISAFNAI